LGLLSVLEVEMALLSADFSNLLDGQRPHSAESDQSPVWGNYFSVGDSLLVKLVQALLASTTVRVIGGDKLLGKVRGATDLLITSAFYLD
jgi:hypothetical protein